MNEPRKRPDRRKWQKRRPDQKRVLRFDVFARDGFRCVYCGADLLQSLDVLLAATVDHFAPRSAGGRFTRDNLVTSCGVCNGLKAGETNLTLPEVREIIAARREMLIAKTLAELVRVGVPAERMPAGIELRPDQAAAIAAATAPS